MILLRPGYPPITRGSLARNELFFSILRLLINPNSGNKTHRYTRLHFRFTHAASTNHSPLTYIKCSLYSPIFPTFHVMDGFPILHIASSQKSSSILNIPIRRISVEAKARARDSKYEDGNEGGGGLSGRGRGERRKGQDRIDALGRLMTKILRHEAEKLKLSMRGDGYVPVNELLKLRVKTFTGLPLCSHNVADVKEAVKNDNKQRLSLLEENGQLLIRANQGHSIKVVDSEKLLKPILSADEVPGMRSNCEIMIFLDVHKALKDGMKLYLSENNVLLTEGLNGIVPPRYFAKIETWPDQKLIH